MRRTVLITIGRLPKALDLARGFHRAGWRVVVAEPFRWHLTGASRRVDTCHVTPAPRDGAAYLDAIIDIARREGADLILPVSEETMHVAALKGSGTPGLPPVFCMPQETVVALHDKHAFPAFAAGIGLDVPETHRLGTEAAAALAESSDVVVKPVFSCSGRGVRIVRRGEGTGGDSPDEPMIVQRFVPGSVVSSFTIAHQGRVAVTSIYRGTVMNGTVSVAFERIVALPVAEGWVRRFVEATGYSGFVSFDFIIDGDGRAYAVECNPRVTSGIHFLRTDALAPLILAPETAPADPFRDAMRLQQFYPCLTETQSTMGNWPLFRRNLRNLLTSRDVSWSWSDPMPLLTMPLTSAPILSQCIFQGRTMGEAATRDIVWPPLTGPLALTPGASPGT